MKKIITLSALLLAVAFTFSSCNKQKSLMRRLVGDWNIDKFEATITPTGGGAGAPFTFANVGVLTFKDGGTGSSVMTILGQTTNSTYVWVNTETTITVTESGQTPTVYTVTTNEKDKQVWSFTESDQTSTTTGTISLTRK